MTAAAPANPSDSPLARMVRDTETDHWNDSCATAELEYAVSRGATGATSNPSIVLEVLRKEGAYWLRRIRAVALANPAWAETDVTWGGDRGDGRPTATVRTLRGFIKSYHDLVGAMRDEVLPDPDTRTR